MKKSKKQNRQPILRFSPTAWAKLLFYRDMTDNEVGGFGITEADDLLFVKDVELVKQKVTAVSVSFDDDDVANFFEDQIDFGRKPEQFARIWLHSHPGDSPEPSCTDEQTFERVFGRCDWAIMAIVAQDNSTYARLCFNAGPGGSIKIPVLVGYDDEFEGTDFALWKQQYLENVTEDCLFNDSIKSEISKADQKSNTENLDIFDELDILDEIDSMDPLRRESFMNELAIRSEFWDEYGNGVFYE